MQAPKPIAVPQADDQSLRLLLVRSRPGELPWLATTIARTMAPVEIVEVVGFANAIWRLGNESFDTVLLDVEFRDPAAMTYFREQIAEVAAVPVLDLREPAGAASVVAASAATQDDPAKGPAETRASRRGLRVPWQRRARRPSQPEPLPATG